MRALINTLLLSYVALSLSACMGYQTGNGLSRFDSKSFWETDDHEGGGDSGAATDSPDHGGGGTD